MIKLTRYLLLCVVLSLAAGCLTERLWKPDYPPGPPVVEIPCHVDGVAYSEISGEANVTMALNFTMPTNATRDPSIPASIRERLAGNTGWLLIQISRPISPLARALLKGGDAATPEDSKLLVRPLLPEEVAAGSAVEASFTFRAGLAEPQQKEGRRALVVREAWPCTIVPDSSFTAEQMTSFPLESFTYFGPSAATARYSPGLTVLRVAVTPLALLVDVPIVLLRAVGRAFAK